ncbi:Mitochondrial RNA pseudouridine synthase Rpusd4 [Lamellibrachia satsuma]|nr:Mitochondrial RNA pseudouridine synthase Rpusd4 [Lamellibrachia satsuma]
MRAVCLPFMDHLLQEIDTRLLVAGSQHGPAPHNTTSDESACLDCHSRLVIQSHMMPQDLSTFHDDNFMNFMFVHKDKSATRPPQQQRRKAGQGPPHWYETELHPWKKEEQLVEDLVKGVLYQDENIVAINKPNGIPMHALKVTEDLPPGVASPTEGDFSIAGVMPALQERFQAKELREVYSQHRLYSGVTLLTKSQDALVVDYLVVLYSGVTLLTKSKDAHDKLQKYFRHVRANKVLHQTYWAFTVGIPHPEVSEEEIALSRVVLHDWSLSVKVNNPSRQKRKSGEVIVSSMKYRLLNTFKSSQCHMALVEIQPVTTKWDAIQLFLLTKLTPVFGDHKYSSRLKAVLDKPVLLKPENCFPTPQASLSVLTNLLYLPMMANGPSFSALFVPHAQEQHHLCHHP